MPSNAVVVRHAPQLELLKRASVCITHAGLNTVLEALAHGVPQVAIPITVDQPGVAARIAEKKTGLVVSLKELTPSRLSLVLDQVLNDSTYRDKARYFQKVIAETNGLSKAANLLEQAFGIRQPRLATPRTAITPDSLVSEGSDLPQPDKPTVMRQKTANGDGLSPAQ